MGRTIVSERDLRPKRQAQPPSHPEPVPDRRTYGRGWGGGGRGGGFGTHAAGDDLAAEVAGTPTTAAAPSGQPQAMTADDYAARLVKYIPADVVALYLTVQTIIAASTAAPPWLLWAVFAAVLVLTPLYLWRVAKITKSLQIALSVLAFVVWVFALPDNPFSTLGWYNALYPAIALPFVTFLIPIVEA